MAELNYINIEGAIGAGKTSLAKTLAEKMDARLILEETEENPFLPDFYKDKRRYAFQTQLFFLLSRHKQQQELFATDLFHKKTISDYFFDKDRIFASVTLDQREFYLYEKLVSVLEKDISRPDLVVYLQTSSEVLLKRIKERGRFYEKNIDLDYIKALNEAYNYYFFHYTKTPLLVVNTDRIDFVHNEKDLADLLALLATPLSGTKYYVPMGRE
ncbi:MAG: deoxyadenosine kinase [candidate division Zixibacteria bacterium SM23_73_3]|nr:MAG: deoxyadenosine kinase [candidate division Zixibacteria bacterium SM23_73_3]